MSENIDLRIAESMKGVDDFFNKITSIDELKMSEMFQRHQKAAQDFERKMLEFMTEKKTRRIYILRIEKFQNPIIEEQTFVAIDTYYQFFSYDERRHAFCAARDLKSEGSTHVTIHDLKPLVDMSDEEFDARGRKANYEYAKKFREAMRSAR